jgi:hypothetical protein
MRDISKRWAIVAASAVLLTGTGGAVAWASIPGSSGIIDGCYSKTTGAVRVIVRGGRHCSRSEAPLSWGQNGGSGQAVRQNFVSFPVGQSPPGIERVSVSCGTGYVATGGGLGLSGPQGIGGNATEKWIPVFDDPATASDGTATGWEAGLAETGVPGNPGAGNYVLNAYAICSPG